MNVSRPTHPQFSGATEQQSNDNPLMFETWKILDSGMKTFPLYLIPEIRRFLPGRGRFLPDVEPSIKGNRKNVMLDSLNGQGLEADGGLFQRKFSEEKPLKGK